MRYRASTHSPRLSTDGLLPRPLLRRHHLLACRQLTASQARLRVFEARFRLSPIALEEALAEGLLPLTENEARAWFDELSRWQALRQSVSRWAAALSGSTLAGRASPRGVAALRDTGGTEATPAAA